MVAISIGTLAIIKTVSVSQTKCAGDIFEDCIKNEGNCWTEFCKCVKIRKGNRENIPAMKDVSGRLVTDSLEKANILNIYSSAFSCERSIPQIQHATSEEPFAVSTKNSRKRLAAISKNKSVWPDGISGEILNRVGKP
jgi:hypothetical protein